MKRIARLMLVCALAALVACTEPVRRPNLLVITIDTLRADALGTYGNPGGHSPHIDAWAAEAVVFDRAVTAIGTTFPSHSTLFTGLYPKRHGVRWNGDTLGDGLTTLAEILKAAGYDTAAFVSMDSLLGRGGLRQGFSAVRRSLHPRHRLHRGEEVNETAIPWLAATRDRPFFLWLHYFEPHAPYRLTPYARRELAGYRGPLARGASVKTVYSLGRELPWTPEETRALRVLYDGEVREADRLVGEVLDTLRRQRATVVVLAADHGQSLGEHGAVGHGFLLSQPVLHVPLVIRVPGLRPARVPGRVGLVDLLPTLLDLLDLPVPPDLDGRSLAGALAGRPLTPSRYFAENPAIGNRLASMRRNIEDPAALAAALAQALKQDPGAVAVFDEEVKGVWSGDGFRVYDLAADPLELDPEPGGPGRADLLSLASGYHEDQAIEASRLEFGEAARRELEALGYLR